MGGQDQQAIESAERAMALAKDLGLDVPAKALGYRGSGRYRLGDSGGQDDMRRALALALERGQGFEAAVLYNNVADSLWPIEGPAASLAAFREGIEFADRRGIADSVRWMSTERLTRFVERGAWAEALEQAGSLAERFEESGSVLGLALVRCVQARLLTLQGRAGEALPLAEWAVGAARDSGSIESVAMAIPVAALARLAAGEQEGAGEFLRDLADRPDVRKIGHYSPFLPEAVRTAVALQDFALAERLASGIEPSYPYQEHALRAARAVLAEAGGETEEAARLYSEAAERWEGFGVVTERAFALLGRGRCLLALGDPTAAEALRQARDIFNSLGARPALEEADALLEQATALTS